jgi:hypothetical protein
MIMVILSICAPRAATRLPRRPVQAERFIGQGHKVSTALLIEE